MYIRTKFFFPATIRWRGIFFGTLLALVSRRKGIKRKDGAKYFAIREVTSCRFFEARWFKVQNPEGIHISQPLSSLSFKTPPTGFYPPKTQPSFATHAHTLAQGVRETNVTGKNPYVVLPPPHPSVFDKSDRDSWIFRENPGLSGQDERKITIFDSTEGRIKKM